MSQDSSGEAAALSEEEITAVTRDWLEQAVIGLNLCPFAKAVHVRNQIRFAVSDARSPEALCQDLQGELERLHLAPADEIDTTLLIHPWALNDFLDFNDFLDVAEAMLEDLGLSGEIQIASFHPDYRFAGTGEDDIENYTNRAPYPILHLLREASIDRAVDAFPDAEEIYGRNMETMRALGHPGWQALAIGKPKAGNTQN